jgi:membrane associated rhomboid family serine protease
VIGGRRGVRENNRERPVRRARNPAQGAKGRAKALPFVVSSRSQRRAVLAVARAGSYLAVRQVQPVTQSSDTKSSQPIFNVPPVVVATVAVLVLIHAIRALALSPTADDRLVLSFAFIPARYSTDPLVSGQFPGGFGADLWTFFTYAFLHADLMHIGLNLAWLIPFGTALARRFGTWRYIAFMLVTAAAGALAQLLGAPGSPAPMIGASAAISGAMAAAMRFMFQKDGPLDGWRHSGPAAEAYRVPAAPLLATLRDPRFLLFLAVWIGLNVLFGVGTISFGEEGQQIAWQAHIGGFFAGLLVFAAFDPPVPQTRLDAEPSG